MKLYHGSNQEIFAIDLSLCKPNKDFGQGFYLTDMKQQAEEMAKRRVRISGYGLPVVTTYEINEEVFEFADLKVKVFDSPCKEWALFILQNRNEKQPDAMPIYDIVAGPVADDGVTFQLERYANGLITLDTLVEELTYRKLNHQYYFGTEKAISYLKKL
nr:DUF3990 domain-containing protein [uncultured Bacteroides sp.]